MNIFRLLCSFTTGLAIFAMPLLGGAAEPNDAFRVVAYVPNWIDLETFSQMIRYDQLTHINVAFENPTSGDGDMSFHSQNEPLIKAAHRHGVKVLVSIGGGGVPSNQELSARYEDLLSADKRTMFANRLLEFVQAHGFDGLDVDIEGPQITGDYGPFIDELANVFKPADKLLTAALSKGYGGQNVPSSALTKFDFVNIMAYDGAGPWNPDDARQHSSLEFAKASAEYFLERGLAKSRAVLGVPFYGYGFGNDFTKTGITYKSILAKYPGAEHVDEVGDTIWYNGMPTITAKTQYSLDQGLGGIMIWSLNQDVEDHRSLLQVIAETSATAR